MKLIGMLSENCGIETPLKFNDRKCSVNISFVGRHKVKWLMKLKISTFYFCGTYSIPLDYNQFEPE